MSFVSTRSRPETDAEAMSRAKTRTASLLAATALFVSASPAMAGARHAGPPPGHHPAHHAGQASGTLAVVPSRTRLVTMAG